MEQMIDLKDLLKHEIMDLHSAEQQIIDALPSMIEKANNGRLKTALKDHLKVTDEQKKRVEELKQALGADGENGEGQNNEKRGFFSRLFGGEEKCKGMEGLIAEGEKLMGADMSPEASDAAIIAAAQKIEHYEISGYGTARAYARELNLGEVAYKLEQTLNEEYKADDLLTQLAVGKVNIEAEFATNMEGGNGKSGEGEKRSGGRSNSGKATQSKASGTSNGIGGSKSRSGSDGTAPGKKGSASKSSSSKSASNSPASKSSSKSSSGGRNSGRSASSNKRSSPSKSASKSKNSSSRSSGSKKSALKSASKRGSSSKLSRRR
jgi:ferritin-like metal-binding protein YciE